jgi:hypothetical protein
MFSPWEWKYYSCTLKEERMALFSLVFLVNGVGKDVIVFSKPF